MNHRVPKSNVKGLFQIEPFFGQPGKSTAIEPGDYMHSWQHLLVEGSFEYMHLRIQVGKLHRILKSDRILPGPDDKGIVL
jgi:hypothetical protein